MKAMIFAAGLGSRLRPLTDTMPKALVPLCGIPMLERILLRLKECGVSEAVVNVHHHADKVVEFLRANGNFGMRIGISDETSRLLDTGGGVAAASGMLRGDEPIMLHNGDIFTDISYMELLDGHLRSGADATLLVAPRATSRYLLFDGEMRMHGWTNVNTGECRPADIAVGDYVKMAFGGVHVISPSVLDDLKDYSEAVGKDVFSITDYYINACSRICIKGWCQPVGTRWHDIGTLDKLRRAECDMSEG